MRVVQEPSIGTLLPLPDESVDGLLAYAAAPVEDVALVLVHGGGQKGSGVLTKLRKLGPVTESKSGELKSSEYASFVAAESAMIIPPSSWARAPVGFITGPQSAAHTTFTIRTPPSTRATSTTSAA